MPPALRIPTIVLYLCLLGATSLHAQDQQHQTEPRPRIGASLDGALNIHSADFHQLPGVPSCCPLYESGTGTGIAIGINYEVPLTSPLSLGFRLGYQSLNATLKTLEALKVIVGSAYVHGQSQHTVDATIPMIALEPSLRYAVTERLGLSLGLGAGIVLSNHYHQIEQLTEPSAGTFGNGLRTQNDLSGTLEGGSKTYFGILGGISYELPLNSSGTMHARPELGYELGLTKLASTLAWKASSFRAGVTVLYDLPKHEPPPPEPPKPIPPVIVEAPKPVPVVPKPKPIVALSVELRGMDRDSLGHPDQESERAVDKVVIEDFIRVQMRPMLNFVFFDHESAELPSRYEQISEDEAKRFNLGDLAGLETLPLYYHVLNILGLRLSTNPSAHITITGCAVDNGDAKLDHVLAEKRATVVRDYLTKVWGVAPTRIGIEARGLPAQHSNTQDSDGISENRRVEIASTDYHVLEPIINVDTTTEARPPILRIIPSDSGATKREHGETRILVNATIVRDTVSLKPEPLVWYADREKESTLRWMTSLKADVSLDDSAAGLTRTQKDLPFYHFSLGEKSKIHSSDTLTARYSLILFDFDRAALSPTNRRIADFVRERLPKNANVRITGYTDRVGRDVYNQQLSESRAKATADYLGIETVTTKGVGRSVLLYDNSKPEGRFYSRTVEILVTPEKK